MIVLNGVEEQVAPGTTVAGLVAGLDLPSRGIAVAVDAEVVRRGDWAAYELADGARVEILTAVQGG